MVARVRLPRGREQHDLAEPVARRLGGADDRLRELEVQERLREFYASALGGEVVAGALRARGWLFVFEVIANYKAPSWPTGEIPKQMHFELMVDDLQDAVSRLEAMGATLAVYQRPGDGGVPVMLDPAGHPFCVGTAADVPPAFADEAARQQR